MLIIPSHDLGDCASVFPNFPNVPNTLQQVYLHPQISFSQRKLSLNVNFLVEEYMLLAVYASP